HYRARFAAVAEKLSDEIDIDRLAHRCCGGAGKIGDGQPRIGARKGVAVRLFKIEAARRAATEAHVGIYGVENRHIDALKPALKHDPAVAITPRDTRIAAPPQIDRSRQKLIAILARNDPCRRG